MVYGCPLKVNNKLVVWPEVSVVADSDNLFFKILDVKKSVVAFTYYIVL